MPNRQPVEELSAADYRRAAVLLKHWSIHNVAGTNVILEEINREQRITEAFLALLILIDEIHARSMAHPEVRAVISALAMGFAKREAEDESVD